MRKFIWFLLAIAVAAYAIYGLVIGDLVMPYHWYNWHDPVKRFGSVHFRGVWAIGGSICLLIGAAGLAILAHGVIGEKPDAKPETKFYKNLATALIGFGAAFFLGVAFLARWFVR